MKTSQGGIGLSVGTGLVLVYLLFPVLVVVTISFSSATYLKFPPPGLSLQWYQKLVASWEWVNSFWLTLQVSGLTMILSTLLGVPAAFAIARYKIPAKNFFNALILASLITPPIIKALSIYLFYVPLGLVNTKLGLAFAHTVSGIPFVIINVAASLRSYDVNLEHAAIIHGARPLQAILRITLPIIAPGIIVGAIFAFMQSAQELLVAIFVMGTVNKPLAVKLWEGVQVAVDPTIAAASTGMIGLAVLAFVCAAYLQMRGRRVRGGT